ncbi:related to endoglucanase c [Phialocephala subalpina]|uniref:Related to endoglucanase c n=1 Tax=Phialocephala subalpina TaxID=576137 RepID=A0A1L7XB98_9HELO|nr:related to endoglucanase c [Phialocephala subalpina]
MLRSLFLLNSIGSALAGTILWDGRFNDMTSSTDLDNWSWSDQTGPYQYYIHGTENVTSYVNLDSTFKNPADTGSTQGVKITLDSTAYWNGQTMRRTELIPQTTAAINSGIVYYHFSMQRTDTNAPSEFREHQICFFESHFTEMKAGWISGESGTSDALLRWDVSSATQWNTTWEAGVWHNIAYAIDFDAGSVAFYHSTGADDLVLTVPAVTVSASSNGADWHLGVLELPRDGYTDATEDIYFSGVYVESGDLTTSVAGPGGASASSSASAASTSTPATSSSVAEASSSVTSTVSSAAAIVSSAPASVASSSVSEVVVLSTATVVPVVSSSSAAVTSAISSPVVASASSIITTPTTPPSTLSTVVAPASTSTAASEPEDDDDDDCY